MDSVSKRKGDGDDEVYSITSARESHSSAVWSREKRYAISMAIRTVCFIGAVVATGPLRWGLLAGAIFLPYIAVVFANQPARKASDGPSPFGMDRPELESRERRELDED